MGFPSLLPKWNGLVQRVSAGVHVSGVCRSAPGKPAASVSHLPSRTWAVIILGPPKGMVWRCGER